MPSTLFKDYLEMVGLNEPITKKAQFWTSYVKSLQGKSDMRAQEKKCSGESIRVHEKGSVRETITAPGYVYTPLYNNIYGLTPRFFEKLEIKKRQQQKK